jgi:hypothetical protein
MWTVATNPEEHLYCKNTGSLLNLKHYELIRKQTFLGSYISYTSLRIIKLKKELLCCFDLDLAVSKGTRKWSEGRTRMMSQCFGATLYTGCLSVNY